MTDRSDDCVQHEPATRGGVIAAEPRTAQRLRGVTLVEVLVVITIMALIAGAVTFLVIPQVNRARIKRAILDAKTVRSAAQLQQSEDPGSECPQVADLVASRRLDADSVADPWGGSYRVLCEGDDIQVVSPGRDGQAGTPDDIYHNFRVEDVDRIAEL